ncbi:hypothetical protein ACWD5R_44505 [Streptomyces sp. NPDC002514]
MLAGEKADLPHDCRSRGLGALFFAVALCGIATRVDGRFVIACLVVVLALSSLGHDGNPLGVRRSMSDSPSFCRIYLWFHHPGRRPHSHHRNVLADLRPQWRSQGPGEGQHPGEVSP